MTLTNALSHERITPLNKTIAMCRNILDRCSKVAQCKAQASHIYASLERLRLMTESQIMQLQSECDLLQIKRKPLRNNSVRELFDEALGPFASDLDLNDLKVEY